MPTSNASLELGQVVINCSTRQSEEEVEALRIMIFEVGGEALPERLLRESSLHKCIKV
jgi:hypothetical protein